MGDSRSNGLSLSDYYDQTLVSETAVSPDGERLAFTATEYDADEEETLTSLFVVPADGSREPHRLTRVAGASGPTWSPDGSRLGFLADRDQDVELKAETTRADEDENADAGEEDDDGDEGADDREEERQVWAFDVEFGGDARQVTARSEGVTEFDWGPDGDRIVVSSRDPTEEQRKYLDEREEGGPIEVERLQHKANGHGWLDEVKTYLFVVDVETREERRLDDAYAGGSMAALRGDGMEPTWGPDDRIAFVANHGDRADDSWALDLFTIGADGENLRKLTDSDAVVTGARWSPDGDRLAFVASDAENMHVPSELRVVDPDGDVDSITADLDRAVLSAHWTGADSLLAVVADEGHTKLYEFGLGGARRDAFPAQDDYTGVLSYGVDVEGGTASLVITRPNERNVYALDLDDGEATRLTDVNGDVFERSTVDCQRVLFESEDAVEVEGIAYYPPAADREEEVAARDEVDREDATAAGDADCEDAAHPLVVNIHGGPTSYDEPGYRFDYHYWVSEGYVVLEVNYRGSISYGREFSESIRGDWGPREAADVEAGVEHLVDRGWVDPDRVFVTGFSQGGVNTAYVLTRTDVATAGAAEHGIYDFYSAFGTDDSHVWWENDFGLPWEEPETYRRTSSITDVDRIDDPLLITAGENDWRCPPSQAEQLYVSVKKRGVDAKLVVYPDVPHSRGGPDVATHRIETVTEWFREHDPAEDESDDE